MRGKNPTLKQKKLLCKKKLIPQNWLVLRNTSELIEFMNKKSGKIRRYNKDAK